MTPNDFTLPGGRKISFELSGPLNAPLVLLSNSLCAPFQSWDPFVADLHAHNYQVLRYDQPGHGASSEPSDLDSTTLYTLSDDIVALLQHLQIKELHAFIGVSMGAATGAVFAAQNPGVVKKLVLCDTITCAPVVAGVSDPFGPRVEMVRTQPDGMETLIEQTLGRWFSAEWRNSNPGEVQRMRSLMRETQMEGFITCCHALQDKSLDLRPLLGKIGSAVKEVMLLVGELDANLPVSMAEMRDKIDQGREKKNAVQWKVIPKAGHMPMIDGKEEFSSSVLEFLK